MKVKPVHGSTDIKCRCDSWLEHWLRFNEGRSTLETCANISCDSKAIVGAHILKENDKRWFVATLCELCVKRKDLLEIGDFSLATANQSLSCNPSSYKK